jgi:hypothetical protein
MTNVVDGPRMVRMRDEYDGLDPRHLVAFIDRDGNLGLGGQDFSPSTAPVSSDGEYEYTKPIAATAMSWPCLNFWVPPLTTTSSMYWSMG